MTSSNRSQLFTTYNAARSLARKGSLDPKRLNRALGLSQSSKAPEYVTTLDRCSCPDATYRPHVICKHRLALLHLEASANPEAA